MALRVRGRRSLQTPTGLATRPTAARVRAAMFNIWQWRVAGCHFLDLCAGSGAMGAEALSRGAAFVLGIERSPQTCELIRNNWRAIAQPEQRWQILCGTLPQVLHQIQGEVFDLIYFDPPYDSDLYEPVLNALAAQGLLAPDGEIALEHRPQRVFALPESLELRRQKRYGSTEISLVGHIQRTDSP